MPNADPATVVTRAAALAARTSPAYETSAIADQDWVRATQAQFQPIRIDDDLWIVPSWCTAPACRCRQRRRSIRGWRSAPARIRRRARACLAATRTSTPGCSVLDYGCGSGILAIAAAKLGARRVVGTDIDPQAVQAGIANAGVNKRAATFVAVDALPMDTFDIVVANILANPLRLLAPAIAARTAPGGRIALAGILSTQADDVTTAYAPWFDVGVWRTADDWVLLAGRRVQAR